MGTISDKLAYTKNAVSDIKTAIIEKGVTIDESTELGDYGQKVRDISSGGIEPIIIDPNNKYIYEDGSYIYFNNTDIDFYVNNKKVYTYNINCTVNIINYIIKYKDCIGAIINNNIIVIYNTFTHAGNVLNSNFSSTINPIIIRDNIFIIKYNNNTISKVDIYSGYNSTQYPVSMDIGTILNYHLHDNVLYIIGSTGISSNSVSTSIDATIDSKKIVIFEVPISNIHIYNKYVLFTSQVPNTSTLLYGFDFDNPVKSTVICNLGTADSTINIVYDDYDNFILCNTHDSSTNINTIVHIPLNGFDKYKSANNITNVVGYLKVDKLKNTYIVNKSTESVSIIVKNQIQTLFTKGYLSTLNSFNKNIVYTEIDTNIIGIHISGIINSILESSYIYLALDNNYYSVTNKVGKLYIYNAYSNNDVNSCNHYIYILSDDDYTICNYIMERSLSLTICHCHYYDDINKTLIITDKVDKVDNIYNTVLVKNGVVVLHQNRRFVTIQNNITNKNNHVRYYIAQKDGVDINLETFIINPDNSTRTIKSVPYIPSVSYYIKDEYNNDMIGVSIIDNKSKLIIIDNNSNYYIYVVDKLFSNINNIIIKYPILAVTHDNGIDIINIKLNSILYNDAISNQSISYKLVHNAATFSYVKYIYIMNNLGIDRYTINILNPSTKIDHITDGDYGNGHYIIAGNIICSDRTISDSINNYNTYDIILNKPSSFKGRCIPITYNPNDTDVLYKGMNIIEYTGYDRLLINDITSEIYLIKEGKKYHIDVTIPKDVYETKVPYFHGRTYIPNIVADISGNGEYINNVKHLMK